MTDTPDPAALKEVIERQGALDVIKQARASIGASPGSSIAISLEYVALLIRQLPAARALAPLQARVEELESALAKMGRTATDRAYMLEAVVRMLGPKGLAVWDRWQEQRVERVHFSWGPASATMSGEEIAQLNLDIEAAPKRPISFDENDEVIPSQPIGQEQREGGEC